jgi:peptide/nickel transport system substrate-binding protein
LDDILAKAMETTDQEQWRKLYAEAQRLINDQAWFILIGDEALAWMIRSEVEGYNPSPANANDYTRVRVNR